ncbi:GMP synthase [Pseudooceanicola sediminis]|uniref:GMP synthase n=1 Tax=Pseudooceanicola sediminis TaxID=2211117 RepID=A0A399J2G2_9RHOB|nr:VIT1/CCC1 transporter family protein [Pseudooceanicola sediminis]KAA2317245.1 GMP synthase [Puniceibacterium sp. HSS470]RII39598.1 GMP synthase [Pseudooceanicola sediminis]|tara:strand:- start:3439 stop:4164 length:726 start_codon:yes stop_codon:yes gene_type:complete
MDWAQHRREAHALGRMQEFLKQIVYGGNDGIVTTFAIVAGFAGAAADGVAAIGGVAVLVFGLANLFADAVSMGLGEFLSGRAQHDLYHARRQMELNEIAVNPDHERDELEVILKQRGLGNADARATADIMVHHPSIMADLMMTYEFGMHDPAEDNPAINGLFTFASFVTFGAVPLVPYFLFAPSDGVFWSSVACTFGALSALGLLRWRTTRENVWRAVGETVTVGAICAVVAYGVGVLVSG